jgi:Ca2+-binding EF-hand superfamily protein
MKFLEYELLLETQREDLFVRQKYFNFVDAFKMLDKNIQGKLTVDTFIDAISELGFKPTPTIQQIIMRFDACKTGEICYSDFC